VDDELQTGNFRTCVELRVHRRGRAEHRMPGERQFLLHRENARVECRRSERATGRSPSASEARDGRERPQKDRLELAHLLRDPLHHRGGQLGIEQEHAQAVAGERLAREDIDERERKFAQAHVVRAARASRASRRAM